jgi:hypothetical protein
MFLQFGSLSSASLRYSTHETGAFVLYNKTIARQWRSKKIYYLTFFLILFPTAPVKGEFNLWLQLLLYGARKLVGQDGEVSLLF